MGKIVEAVSGHRPADYLQQHLFAPLGQHLVHAGMLSLLLRVLAANP
jgi:CubicO group peptidase (beta-lactamase class C family)